MAHEVPPGHDAATDARDGAVAGAMEVGAVDENALTVPLDGSYRFSELCGAATTESTTTLTIHGAKADLASAAPTRTLRLRSAGVVSKYGGDSGGRDSAFLAFEGTSSTPLFRAYKRGSTLVRMTLTYEADEASAAAPASDERTWGSFEGACTAREDVSFVETSVDAARAWTGATFGTSSAGGAVTFRYPSKLLVLKTDSHGAHLASSTVFGFAMNGGRYPYEIHIEVKNKPLLDVLKTTVPGVFGSAFPSGTEASFTETPNFFIRAKVASVSAYCYITGIEGTNAHTYFWQGAPGRTLVVDVRTATDFANPKITMSEEEQIDIALRVMGSIRL